MARKVYGVLDLVTLAVAVCRPFFEPFLPPAAKAGDREDESPEHPPAAVPVQLPDVPELPDADGVPVAEPFILITPRPPESLPCESALPTPSAPTPPTSSASSARRPRLRRPCEPSRCDTAGGAGRSPT